MFKRFTSAMIELGIVKAMQYNAWTCTLFI